MATAQGPLPGFRDLLAEQMLPRDQVVEIIKNVYELYGFVPLKTPALELQSTLAAAQYGDEGDKLTYAFEDNGGRKVAMRYDHTVPLARVVSQHGAKLPTPYKRYVLADVWRGERPQAGRYREFAQFDADIIGSSSYLADTEVLAMTADAMSKLGLKVSIRVNDRRLLHGLAESCELNEKKDFTKLVTTIDKVDKIGMDSVLDEMQNLFGAKTKDTVYMYLVISGSNEVKLHAMMKLLNGNEQAKNALSNLSTILDTLSGAGYGEEIIFDQSIARGLNYYTGTIFETTLTNMPDIGSVCSGGRFDELIKQLGGPDLPAVGTSIGVDRLMEAMNLLGLIKQSKTKTKVYITNVDDGLDIERFKLAKALRAHDIAAEIIYGSPKLGRQMELIDKLGVENIIILGQKELANKTVLIKNLQSGEQREVARDKIVSEIQ